MISPFLWRVVWKVNSPSSALSFNETLSHTTVKAVPKTKKKLILPRIQIFWCWDENIVDEIEAYLKKNTTAKNINLTLLFLFVFPQLIIQLNVMFWNELNCTYLMLQNYSQGRNKIIKKISCCLLILNQLEVIEPYVFFLIQTQHNKYIELYHNLVEFTISNFN